MTIRHPTLGSLLHALRLRKGWTLKEMSQTTGIPVSTLSKVEHDRLTLSYDKLAQLSQRLNIRISELFADPTEATEPAVTARRSIGKLDDAVRVNTQNYDYYYLCPELRRKRMIPILTQDPLAQRRGVRGPGAPFGRGVHLCAQGRHQGAHRFL